MAKYKRRVYLGVDDQQPVELKKYALFYPDQFGSFVLVSGGHWDTIKRETAIEIARLIDVDRT